jgi:DNA-binding transcriptional MerR regulator
LFEIARFEGGHRRFSRDDLHLADCARLLEMTGFSDLIADDA